MPYFISEKKADSVSISVQCCTPTFRKSYFYLPVYPFSEQFFLLLFTDLIIIFCFQPVKDFCSTRSDTLCKTAQGLHEKCRINTQIDTPGSQKQSPRSSVRTFRKSLWLQCKHYRQKQRQEITSLNPQNLIIPIGRPLTIRPKTRILIPASIIFAKGSIRIPSISLFRETCSNIITR